MKPYVLLCFCLLGRGAFAQTESATAFKGANALVLVTVDSAGPALRKFADCLAVHGARPWVETREPLRFRTLPWALLGSAKRHVTYTVTATPGPNAQLTITGEVGQLVREKGLELQNVARAAVAGREKGASLQAFRLMEGAAKHYMDLAKIQKKRVRLRYVQQ